MYLKDIPYDDQFYWKGQRWRQLIRPKSPAGKFKIVCCHAIGESEWIDMPAMRQVKPITRVIL